ncbi:MAG: hypothetical protein M0006_04815 [Magnetospirillum sp.]|nr:hypothetical protein [Magnetospirillum sp.]
MIDLSRVLWLDVEASGFGPESYPIEVGWSDIAGRTGSVLVRPEPTWTYWDLDAEGVHGISLAMLAAEGVPAAEVAARIVAATADRMVFSDNPRVDAWWLARLFKAAGTDTSIRLFDGHSFVYTFINSGGLTGEGEYAMAQEQAKALAPITHRAADDARFWATLTRLVAEGA